LHNLLSYAIRFLFILIAGSTNREFRLEKLPDGAIASGALEMCKRRYLSR
jgi:hypothetical protein